MLNAARQLEEVIEILPFMLATILSEKLVGFETLCHYKCATWSMNNIKFHVSNPTSFSESS